MAVINALGRRKTAIARVYLSPGTGKITVNGKDHETYFAGLYHISKLTRPFEALGFEGKYDVKVNAKGGGVKGQIEAIMLGIARALVKVDDANKPALKGQKLLTRDPRMVERKKFGHKKARKSFQFSKR
ncbi:MAG: 30S ribosomal protein S9 [Chitinophagales bacterium]|nr:30S ribosomal protein S9 [Chitinophagales bacterium]